VSQQTSVRIKEMVLKRAAEGEAKLKEVDEWVERLKSAGFSVGDLESRLMQARIKNERLKELL
jgi:hypothetical protein